MKPHIFVLLAFVLCVGMIIPPVSAYDLLYSFTGNGVTGGYGFSPEVFQVHNWTAFKNVTRIEFTSNSALKYGAALSGSKVGAVKVGSNYVGNYTATWAWTGVGVWENPFYLYIDLTNLVGTGIANDTAVEFEGLDSAVYVGGGSGYIYVNATNPNPFQSYYYGVSNIQPYFNATTAIYGGTAVDVEPSEGCNGLVPPGYSRTNFQCTDSFNSAVVTSCDIQLHDLEGGAWSNATNTAGTWCIDTFPYHHINGYGQSNGYTEGSRLNVQEWNGQTYTILMVPGYVPPAADGYVWVYVHVTDWSGSQDIEDARVSLSGLNMITRSDYTDGSGVVHLQWKNASEAYINVGKPGYTTSMTVITTSDFGPDTVNIQLHAGTQTMTIVPTTGPGGTVPTTLGPYGSQTPAPGVPMPEGYTNLQGQAIMDLLAYHGYDLVLLCILVTMLALLGVKLGGR